MLRVSHQDCDGATLYVTGLPCWECSKLIVGSGVRRVVYLAGRRPVDLETVLGLHDSCGVDLVAVDSAEIVDLAA